MAWYSSMFANYSVDLPLIAGEYLSFGS